MKLCPGHERLSSDYSDWKCGAQCRFCQGACQKCFPEPETPTPSITVGTQVRLTGVVADTRGFAIRKNVGVKFSDRSDEPLIWFGTDEVEVIRQPFKRGEVVWQGTTELSVLADEEANTVLLVEPMAGAVAFGADAHLFERRP